MGMIRKREKKAKKDTSFATWKFEFENTVNADPRLGAACLCVTRVYLDWMGSPSATPFLSTAMLAIATALSENTVRQARRALEKEGYFILVGKSSSGVPMYKLVNAGLHRVLDHVTIAREKLKEIEAEKKAAFRKKRPALMADPSKSDWDMSPSESEVEKPFVPFRNRRDSPSDFEPNNVYNSVDPILCEKGRGQYHASEEALTYALVQTGDEANDPLPIPGTEIEADQMIGAICADIDVLPVIQNRMKSMLLAGVLTPNLARGMLGGRREAA